MELIDIAKSVKAGVRFLDKRIPNWRTVLRRHADEFDFSDGDCCVLGTLEHYSGRMRELKRKRAEYLSDDENRYGRASAALNIDGQEAALGFDTDEDGELVEDDYMRFDALWRAEFEA